MKFKKKSKNKIKKTKNYKENKNKLKFLPQISEVFKLLITNKKFKKLTYLNIKIINFGSE